MFSGSCSFGGIWIVVSLRPAGGGAGVGGSACGIVPVMSAAVIGAANGAAAACGIVAEAAVSETAGVGALSDCRPIGVGDVIDGIAGTAGLTLSAGAGA